MNLDDYNVLQVIEMGCIVVEMLESWCVEWKWSHLSCDQIASKIILNEQIYGWGIQDEIKCGCIHIKSIKWKCAWISTMYNTQLQNLVSLVQYYTVLYIIESVQWSNA